MDQSQTTLYKGIAEKVIAALPKDVEVLYISLGGSKGKGLGSPNSDYDVKVVLLNSFENYLLQRVHLHLKVDTMLEDLSLEGQAIDITRAFDYAIETNAFITELLRSPCVYQKDAELSKTLRDVTEKCYNPYMPLHALNGILLFYLNRELKNKEGYKEKVKAKALAETIYITLQLRALLDGQNMMSFFTIDSVLKYAGEEEKIFNDIITQRRENKEQELPLTKELITAFESINEKSYAQVKLLKDSTKNDFKKVRQEQRKVSDDLMLRLIKNLKESSVSK